jgi:ribonuclease HII
MICGVDEAGRGPVLGPLVICGIAVESDEALKKLGVRDSKKLTPKRREALAAEIVKIAKVELVEISAEEIDSLRKRMTMNEIEAIAFAAIVEKLSPDVAYLDAADVDEDNFGRAVSNRIKCDAQIVSQHKADDTFPVVSAASIIAKVNRDRRVREIEREIGRPIGSGYQTDDVTMTFLEDWIKEKGSCPPHTRQSWEPAQSLMRMKDVRRLDQFE